MRTSGRILFVALAMTVGAGCTRNQSGESSGQAHSTLIGLNKPSFKFDYKKARSLTIAKADPMTGDHWMTRVERQQDNPETFYDSDFWTIQSYSENGALADRLANRNLILHLLDTLSTFHPTEAVQANGDSEPVRESFGLRSPRYALQWQAWDSDAGILRTFEVTIGNPVDPSHPASTESYGSFPPNQAIYKVDGAAISMLGYMKNFTILRQESLSPLDSDDVDEIEIYQGKRKIFYAQRDGEFWTRESHHRLKKDVAGFLDRVTHLRIKTFLENSERPNIAVELEKHPVGLIVLKDRYSKPTEFRFARVAGKAYGSVSTRPGAVFELYPEALSKLSP